MSSETTSTWDAGLRSLDLDAMQPIFPDSGRAKDAAVGLDDERCYRRRGRHETSDASRISRAKDVLQRLPVPGESFHVLLSGHFRNSDFIPALLDLAETRCDRLSICTLGYDRKTGDMLLRELDDGRIVGLQMLSCVYHQSHEPQLHGWISAELDRRGSRHLAARVHVKVMAFDLLDGRRITVESSANLRSCNMAELTTITADHGLTAFHHDWISALFEKGEHAMSKRPAPPEHLDESAQRKWTELLPTLPDQEPGTLDALSNYAAAWSRMISAEAKVGELGPVVRSPQGFPVQNPYLCVLQAERRAVRQWGAELRLTPASRAKGQRQKSTGASALQILTAKGRSA